MARISGGRERRQFFTQLGALGAAVAAPSWLGCGSDGKKSTEVASLESSPRIDTHQHFWTYSSENYSWIDPASAVARDFAPLDLQPELDAAGMQGTVLVEARSDASETEHLLGIAAQASFVRGVVGWLPLVDPNVGALIERHAANPKLRGLRHAIAAEADPEFMFGADFNRGIALLGAHGLRFDLLLVPGNLSRASRFVNEADLQHWQASDLQPYLDVALEAFTPRRMMFGSDWPMCVLATSYSGWFNTAYDWLAQLSPSEQNRILGGTALEAYGLSTS
jgi:L-fuconolactonase